MNLQEFISHLEVKSRSGNQYSCLCPAHDDHNASLSVSEGKDGKILLRCFAGCDPKDIMAALGLTEQDLFQKPTAKEDFRPQGKDIKEASYVYRNKDGRPIYRKTKWRQPDGGKHCTWQTWSGGHWQGKRSGDPVLYNLPDISETETVFLVEGEKDVETLKSLGYVATSAPDGAASRWRDQYTEALRDKNVYIIQDNDDPGKKFAVRAAKALHGAAKTVRVVDLTQEWPDLKEHGDVTDVYESLPKETEGFGDFQSSFSALLQRTPAFDPETVEETDGWSAVSAADVEITPREWLMQPYLEKGTGTLIQGNNGSGKTYLACALAAQITTGKPILGEVFPQETGNVLFLSVEDDEAVLAERIQKSGGNLKKCFLVRYPDDADVTFLSPEIERLIRQTNAKAVIFDPLQNFLGADVDMHRANETHPIFRQLIAMCKRQNCSCIIVAHTGKDTFNKAMVNQALGSVDIPASMRSIIHVLRNPADPDEALALHVKCSHAKTARTLAYEITDFGLHYKEYRDITEQDLHRMQLNASVPTIPYEDDPLVKVFQELKKDLTGDRFISYAEFGGLCSEIIQMRPYETPQELAKKINAIANKLQEHEKIIVTAGERRSDARGIRIKPYFEVIEEYDDSY